MFYTLAYAIMSLGGFGIVLYMSRAGFEAEELDDYKGLNQRSPWFAFMMLILMFSMAGVPPTLGFWAKLAVLSAVVDINMTWLAVVAVVFSIIGLFYYLRIVKLMYFDDAVERQAISCGRDMQIALSTNSVAILALGIYPAGLMSICSAVFG
jgi:NADH-quinone oxidoreductase subunit N